MLKLTESEIDYLKSLVRKDLGAGSPEFILWLNDLLNKLEIIGTLNNAEKQIARVMGCAEDRVKLSYSIKAGE